MVWEIELFGYSLALFLYGLLSVLTLKKSLTIQRRWLFIFAPIGVVLWSSAGALNSFELISYEVTQFFHTAFLSCWALLALQISAKTAQQQKRAKVILLAIALLTAIATFSPLFTNQNIRLAATIYGAGMCLITVYGLKQIEQILRTSDSERLWALKHLVLGFGLVFIYGLITNTELLLFGLYNVYYQGAHGFIVALAAPLIAISMMRYKSWQLDIHVSREIIYQSGVLVISGSYLIAVALAGFYLKNFGGDWGVISSIITTAAAVVTFFAVLSSASLRAKLRVWINKHFFSHKYDYRKEWLRFTNTLSDANNDKPFHHRLILGLGDIVDSTGGAIWLHAPEDKAYSLATTLNMGRDLFAIPEGHDFITHLKNTGEILDLSDYSKKQETSDKATQPALPELPDWLANNSKAWLAIPLMHNQFLLGVLILAIPRIHQTLDWEDYGLLSVASQQVASYAAEEQAIRELQDAQRLDSFNKRFVFIVHDLKNAISQLSMLLKNAEKHHSNPDFQKDMLKTIENTVTRMTNMMQRMKSDTPDENGQDSNSIKVNVFEVLKATFEKWRYQTANLKLDLPDIQMKRMLDKDKFTTILDHLIANATEAAGPDGMVTLQARLIKDDIVINIIDTGPGMTEEFIRDKLFKPFSSEKEEGLGIGVYQVQKLVHELGGRIEVKSQPNAGTTMSIYFAGL